MFRKIQTNPKLMAIISSYCDENGIEVCLSKKLDENSDDKLIILKPDEYYSTKNMPKPPPSVDCIILVKCDSEECYNIYLIELKNIKSQRGFSNKNIVQKFKTVIEKFLNSEFGDIFLKEKYCNFNCYFVANPYGCKNMSDAEYSKKIHDESLKLDYFNSIKPFKFQGRYILIESKLPNPIISEC